MKDLNTTILVGTLIVNCANILIKRHPQNLIKKFNYMLPTGNPV